MKKIFIFTCCLLLLLQITYIPVKAVEATMDFPDVFFAPHIFYGLNNGIEYDFSKYSDYDNPLAAKNAFYEDLFYDLTGQNYNDVDVENYMNSYYTMDFGYTTSQYSQLLSGYSQYILDPSLSFTLPWTTNGIASWNRFNEFYVDKYLNKLNGGELGVAPTVSDLNVPVFSWPYSNYTATVGVEYEFSFQSGNQYLTFRGAKYPAVLGRIGESGGIVVGGNLTSSGSNVVVNLSSFSGSIDTFTSLYEGLAIIPNGYDIINGSLHLSDTAFAYLTNGLIASSDNIALAPDVIRNPDNDKMIGNDIPVPNVPDLTWDLGKLNDLINDAFENGTTVTWDDVVDNDVISHDDGTTLEDDDTRVDPISRVIEDEKDVPYEDIIPPVPPPPPTIKNWNFDFDPDIPDPRPRSLSVLARIVNVTNKSLPEEVMIMFWGICATLLILGLIKIMHK